jgi:hypothetical protein
MNLLEAIMIDPLTGPTTTDVEVLTTHDIRPDYTKSPLLAQILVSTRNESLDHKSEGAAMKGQIKLKANYRATMELKMAESILVCLASVAVQGTNISNRTNL